MFLLQGQTLQQEQSEVWVLFEVGHCIFTPLQQGHTSLQLLEYPLSTQDSFIITCLLEQQDFFVEVSPSIVPVIK